MIIISDWQSQDNEFDKIDLAKKGNIDIYKWDKNNIDYEKMFCDNRTKQILKLTKSQPCIFSFGYNQATLCRHPLKAGTLKSNTSSKGIYAQLSFTSNVS